MNSKKIAAIIASVLMLSTPVFATSVTQVGNIMDMVTVTDSTVSFPIFVIGSTAATADVAGAVGTAVRMAAQAKTTSTVTVPTVEPVATDGVLLQTATNKLAINESLNNPIPSLTATHLPTTLAIATYLTAAGRSYGYSQYLSMGSSPKVTYKIPATENEPSLVLDVPAAQVYEYKLVFSDSVEFTDSTDFIGSSIDFLGKPFIITAATIASNAISDLTMLSGKTSTTIMTGESKVLTVDAKDYTVTLSMVGTTGSVLVAVLDVNGESISLKEGATKALADGTLMGATNIIQGKTGVADSVTIFLGADKVKLVASGNIVINDITQSAVTSTISSSSSKWTTLTITHTPISEAQYKAGTSIEDPAFKAFKIFFHGLQPTIDDTSRESITLTPNGKENFRLTFKNKAGQTIPLEAFACNQANCGGSSSNIKLGRWTGSTYYKLHITETNATSGALTTTISKYQRFIVSANEFTRYIEFTAIDTTTKKVTLTDVAGAKTYTLTYASNPADGASTATDVGLMLDGNEYGVYVYNNSGTYDILVNLDGDATWSETVNIYTTGISSADGGQIALSEGSLSVNVTEEKMQGQTTGKKFYMPVTWDSTYGIQATAPTDIDSGLSMYGVGATTLSRGLTVYGTHVEADSSAQGRVTVKYPDSQAFAIVAVGSDPKVTVGGAGGQVTTETVLPITADIVKLDSEITSTDKTTKDLILVGGPCVNTLVAELATAGKFPYTCAGWPGRNFGRVQVISGGFATGYTVGVIAGTRAADTDLAARIVQTGFPGATSTQKAGSYLEITGTVTSPAYST